MSRKPKERNDEKEKYSAYLCSREWNVLKEAVHKRAHGKCERCCFFLIDAVHHLTYERKYHEDLTDLQGICKHCHDFTHGKSDFDPAAISWSIRKYLLVCVSQKLIPAPVQVADPLLEYKQYWKVMEIAIRTLTDLEDLAGYPCDLSEASDLINRALPFDLKYLNMWRHRDSISMWRADHYDKLRTMLGYPRIPDEQLVDNPSCLVEED